MTKPYVKTESERKAEASGVTRERTVEVLDQIKACLERGEPVFILRAQDMLAPALVRAWIALAETHGVSPKKLMSAQTIVWAMEKWPNRKIPD